MSKRDFKEDELRRFAELIMSSNDRGEMMQRLNGFTVGLQNGHAKKKRVDLMKRLIALYV